MVGVLGGKIYAHLGYGSGYGVYGFAVVAWFEYCIDSEK